MQFLVFSVLGSEFRAQGSGFRVKGVVIRVSGAGLRVDHPGGGAGLMCLGACHATAHISTAVAQLYRSEQFSSYEQLLRTTTSWKFEAIPRWGRV